MKKDKTYRIFQIICLILIAFSLCLLVKAIVKATKDRSDDDKLLDSTLYIIYTDEESHPYALVTYPKTFESNTLLEHVEPKISLSSKDREKVARIVAGQAVGESLTCQTMVANVMYNQMLANGGKIKGTEYSKCDRRTPTKETYEAIDAIFIRGEWLLDDTVLWTGNVNDTDDEWYSKLNLVTTCGSLAFYEKR